MLPVASAIRIYTHSFSIAQIRPGYGKYRNVRFGVLLLQAWRWLEGTSLLYCSHESRPSLASSRLPRSTIRHLSYNDSPTRPILSVIASCHLARVSYPPLFLTSLTLDSILFCKCRTPTKVKTLPANCKGPPVSLFNSSFGQGS
jgi:hypothetical protein